MLIFFGRSMRLSGLALLFLFPFLLRAEILEKGIWAGKDFKAIGAGDVLVAESPLAAVFICKHGTSNYDLLTKFESWTHSPDHTAVPAFAVIVLDNEEQHDVAEEVITQRGFKIPVLTTSEDLLDGSQYRLALISENQLKTFPDFDLAALTQAVGTVAQASSPMMTVSQTPETTSPRKNQARNPLYVNQRYEFSIRWPKGWDYKVARNGDGAVGIPPEGLPLEARVWAAPEIKSDDPSDPPPYVQIKDYLNYLKTQARGEIQVESKLKVFDGDIEGRDYTYSYVRAGKEGQPDMKYRGRIQAFVVDGIAKLVCVEGPEEVFKQNSNEIEKFIYTFHPFIE